MWFLKKLSDGCTKYLISENKSYTVGRKNCDITLEEDSSVSRKHCTIYVAKQSECPFAVNTFTGVWIADEGSKYGTYIKNNNDWLKINAGLNKKLNSGCVIRFGLMENVWSLEYKPLIVCVSGIPIEQKKKIISSLQLIDSCLKNSWCKECSLVIVNEITLTVKVVLALIHGVPIVTPVYLQKVVESVKNQHPFPNHDDYRPDLKEILLDKSLVSFDSKECRKELFKGKKFIIPTKKQLETLSEIITSAGGSAELLSVNESWEKFAEDNIVMIQLPFNNIGIPDELNKSVKEITSFLKSKYERRVIPECEIAQAVAYTSVEKYCNPKSNWFNIKIGERKDVDLGPVIIEETPIRTQGTRHSPTGVVPCSATMESEPLLQSSEPKYDLIEPSEVQLDSRQEFPLDKRKRMHSLDLLDEELQKKKARHIKATNVEDYQDPKIASSLMTKTSQINTNETESKSSQSRGNQFKSSYITNYFQKQNKSAEESSSEVLRQKSNDFWNYNLLSNYNPKRKISSESEGCNESSSKKKVKLSEVNVTKQKTPAFENDAPEVIIQNNKNNEKSKPFSPKKKIRNVQEENDFIGFFEKENTESVNDLNNTLFSLNLISPAYLKEDGSLIDAPEVLNNVKRFKKQKILLVDVSFEENEDELLQGDWIEPHTNRHNISVAE